jgi:hypothetical protein
MALSTSGAPAQRWLLAGGDARRPLALSFSARAAPFWPRLTEELGGTRLAITDRVQSKRIDILECWAAALALRRTARAIATHGRCAVASVLRALLHRASDAACATLAEASARRCPLEAAQCLRIAVGRLQETRHLIVEAYERGVASVEQRDEGERLARGAIADVVRARLHLLAPRARDPAAAAGTSGPRAPCGWPRRTARQAADSPLRSSGVRRCRRSGSRPD